MAKYFYYNEKGEKKGAFSGKEIKALAKAGLINPQTIIETEEGKQYYAHGIENLKFGYENTSRNPFTNNPPKPVPMQPCVPIPVPVESVEGISNSLTSKEAAVIAGGVFGGILLITLIIFAFAVWIPAAQERAQLEKERIAAELEEQERQRIVAVQERQRLAELRQQEEQERQKLAVEQREREEHEERERVRIAQESEQQRVEAEQREREESERRRIFEERREQGQLRTEEIIELVEQSVARIEGPISSGSGFLIRPKILSTNYHVIDDMFIEQVKIFFPSADGSTRGPFGAELLYANPGRDIALLRVETNLPALSLAENHEFRRGQDIIAIGSPGNLENAVNIGVLSSERVIDSHTYYQLGISINSGNSGGPIIDRQGNVIGIATLKAAKQEGIAYCIQLADVQRALTETEQQSESQKTRQNSDHRARVALQMISDINDIYLDCMDEVDTIGEIALDGGYSFAAAERVAAQEVEGRMNTARLRRFEVERELKNIEKDSILSVEIRWKLNEYHSYGLQIKSYVDRPRGSFNEYRQKYNEFKRNDLRLYKELRSLLGMPE